MEGKALSCPSLLLLQVPGFLSLVFLSGCRACFPVSQCVFGIPDEISSPRSHSARMTMKEPRSKKSGNHAAFLDIRDLPKIHLLGRYLLMYSLPTTNLTGNYATLIRHLKLVVMYVRALAHPSIIRCAPTPICQAQAPGCAPVLLLEVTTPLFGEPVVIAPNYSLYLFRMMPSNRKGGHEEENCTDCSIVVTQGKRTEKSKILHLFHSL